MRQILLSIHKGHQLFSKNDIHGVPVEKCDIENLKNIQKNGCWLRTVTDAVPEFHYFRFFQCPENEFPGLSAIRACGKKIEISDECSYFLADFMTVDGLKVVDIANISEDETKALAEEILGTFDYFEFSIVRPGQILVWFQGEYPFINWHYPYQIINSNYRDSLPGQGSLRAIVRIIENSFRLLEKHPVNRVRIDLGENPANFLWFHSQSRTVKRSTTLSEKTGKKFAFWSNNTELNDIALYLGFEISENIPLDVNDSIIWMDFKSHTDDIIGLMHTFEFIDKKIISAINDVSDRFVIEFNSGFYDSKYALNFLYPAEKISFFKKFQIIKKTPGNFLIGND